MHKSLEVMQRRNRRQNAIIAEQARAIAKLYAALTSAITLLERLDQQNHCDRGAGKYEEDESITQLREVLKEVKL